MVIFCQREGDAVEYLLKQEKLFLDTINDLFSDHPKWLYVADDVDTIIQVTHGEGGTRTTTTGMHWSETKAMILKLRDSSYLTAEISPGGSEIYFKPTYKGMHYRRFQAKEISNLWIKNAWIPILVSLVTNLAIAGLKQLWPLILGWLSNSP